MNSPWLTWNAAGRQLLCAESNRASGNARPGPSGGWGALLPAVGVAILLKQVADSFLDFIPFFLGFALAAGMGLNLIGAAIVGGMFAIINYKIQMLRIEAKKAASAAPAKASSDDDDDDEEDI